MTLVTERIAAAGIILPSPLVPRGSYVPYLFNGPNLIISGQVSMDEAGGVLGTVGDDVDMATAQRAARMCGINLLAQISAALDGDFERVVRVVRLNGFIQAAGNFSEIAQVMNGCSDLFAEVFGERGLHTRSTVGVYRLPRGCAVEVDAVIEVAA